jgi:hypothetical protein
MLQRLRATGLMTWSVAVRHPDTPEQLLEQADSRVEEVEGMMGLFKAMVQYLELLAVGEGAKE